MYKYLILSYVFLEIKKHYTLVLGFMLYFFNTPTNSILYNLFEILILKIIMMIRSLDTIILDI